MKKQILKNQLQKGSVAVWILFVFLATLIIAGVGYYYYTIIEKSKQSSTIVEPTSTPIVSPTTESISSPNTGNGTAPFDPDDPEAQLDPDQFKDATPLDMEINENKLNKNSAPDAGDAVEHNIE